MSNNQPSLPKKVAKAICSCPHSLAVTEGNESAEQILEGVTSVESLIKCCTVSKFSDQALAERSAVVMDSAAGYDMLRVDVNPICS